VRKQGYNTTPYNTTPFNYAIPASETKEGKERLRIYYEALGRFIDMFSKIEMAAHIVLRHYAKMTTATANALLSGVRVDETKNRLQRLFDAGIMNEADWNDAEPIFQHLAVINGRRNNILHHGAISVAEGFGIVTNANIAHTQERGTKFPISPDILDNMTADLRKIMIHLYTRHAGRPPLLGAHPEIDALLRASWRYTQQPSPPAESGKSARSGHTTKKSHQDQPKPFQEWWSIAGLSRSGLSTSCTTFVN
jgi:hypothetical protein